jgi:molybdenum cofactor synthesis domain-containing protein
VDFEIVAIGNELLLGFTVDSNSANIGLALAPAGARVVRRTTVGDTPAEIRQAVGEALQRTGHVITTGGLGPTKDDITKKSIAELFGVPLDFDEEIWQSLVGAGHHAPGRATGDAQSHGTRSGPPGEESGSRRCGHRFTGTSYRRHRRIKPGRADG